MWSTYYRFTIRISRGAAGETEIFGSNSEAKINRVAEREIVNRPGPCALRIYDRDEKVYEHLIA